MLAHFLESFLDNFKRSCLKDILKAIYNPVNLNTVLKQIGFKSIFFLHIRQCKNWKGAIFRTLKFQQKRNSLIRWFHRKYDISGTNGHVFAWKYRFKTLYNCLNLGFCDFPPASWIMRLIIFMLHNLTHYPYTINHILLYLFNYLKILSLLYFIFDYCNIKIQYYYYYTILQTQYFFYFFLLSFCKVIQICKTC